MLAMAPEEDEDAVVEKDWGEIRGDDVRWREAT